jgi:hypothetical protein
LFYKTAAKKIFINEHGRVTGVLAINDEKELNSLQKASLLPRVDMQGTKNY